ncbi:MAG: type II toxin-antitoxin system RelE family toxin [Nocardioidaceae bacterium]
MSPSYRIQLSSEAKRGLNRLPPKVAAAVIEFMTGPLPENPHRLSKPLGGDLADYRSARRGDYRVLIRIIEGDTTVLVYRIEHRANVYRPR